MWPERRLCIIPSLSPVGCGGNLTTPTGTFTSPNYPMPYYHSSECYWWLKASQGSPFELEFEEFHLEHHPNCTLDYLAVCIQFQFYHSMLPPCPTHINAFIFIFEIWERGTFKQNIHINILSKIKIKRKFYENDLPSKYSMYYSMTWYLYI